MLPPWIPLCCIQKITTCSTVTKERSKKNREMERKLFFFFLPGVNQRWKEKKKGQNSETVLCADKPRGGEMPSSAAWPSRFSCLRLFSYWRAPLNAQAGRINRIHTTWERALPLSVTAPIHTVDICVFDFGGTAEVKTSSIRGCGAVRELRGWTWLVEFKAGGRAARCTPSLLLLSIRQLPLQSYASPHSHTACAFCSSCVIWGVFFDFVKCMTCHMQQPTGCRIKV